MNRGHFEACGSGSKKLSPQLGNFYKGRHEPIISKELFNKVAEQLKTNKEYREYGLKDFAFSRLIKCGKCLSGVCAEEKVHVQKNGNRHRYVYYACSMSRDRKCRREYIKEQDLITQFIGLMDEVDLNEIGIREKMKREIGRYNKFRAGVLEMENDQAPEVQELDIRNYAKYILREGSITEQRELLFNLKGKVYLKYKKIYLG